METLLVMLSNWKTTLLGFVVGVALYVVQAGVTLPRTADEWWTFAFAALVAGLGLAAKDATTGSRPRLILLPLLALALAGCVGPIGFAALDADQLAAAVKDKNASVGCVKVQAAGGVGVLVIVNADKGVPAGTKVTPDCGVEFMSGGNGR